MKVYIGPYKNWIGPYQIAKLLKYIGVSDDKCHDIGAWLSQNHTSWLEKVCEWIDSKRKRTLFVKVDPYDTWNIDTTVAVVVLPLLKQFRQKHHGSPGTMEAFKYQSSDSYPQLCFDFYGEEDEKIHKLGHEQWNAILDEMIWTFEQLQPGYDWEQQYWASQPELDLTRYPEDEGKTIVPVRWKSEGKCDWEGRQNHQARISDGLRLFGQYYQNLWD